ncbi:MAG TPA: ABC-three component system protein [Pirellulales bacterium]|jgi:hypothetical protein|nr:ABC-three component system protein [Pirellulales bacterium]
MNSASSPSSVPSNFSADDSILGFKYQLRYALYLLYDAQRADGLDVAIDIERIDDIDVHAANKLTKLVQTKDTATILTNSSAPFWKTIRIWSDAIRNGVVDPTAIRAFLLVTTSPNPADDSAIVNLLQQNSTESRQEALSQMQIRAATKRPQDTLGKAYQAFHDLPSIQQKQLVEKITIQTSAPTFDGLDELIYDQIVHGPPNKRVAFGKVLFGRWDQLVEAYLRERSQAKITWQELQSLLHEISLQFEEDNLPIEFIDMLRHAIPSLSDDNRTFMKQLIAIGATPNQRQRAQRLYLKATQLLGFWQRNLLVRPDEVLHHNQRLIDECELQHEGAGTNSGLASASAEEVGRHIYKWANEHAPHLEALRIRRRCSDADVIRGCLHALADAPRLGWHPDWNILFVSPTLGE